MIRFIASASLAALLAVPALADPAALYADNCASCHGADRLGGTGPALIPETLKRMRGPKLGAVITGGRAATQMPAFGDTLSETDIAALTEHLKTPLAEIPAWGPDEIAASTTFNPEYTVAPAAGMVFDIDPMNLFLVVETGDHHVSVLDGDRFEVIDRFPTPFAVHGGPKFTPDGHFVFIMSRDGWVQKYDVWTSSSCRAMDGCRNTMSGASRRSVGCEPASTAATSPFPRMASTWPWPTTCRTR
jgi:cytochrome c553